MYVRKKFSATLRNKLINTSLTQTSANSSSATTTSSDSPSDGGVARTNTSLPYNRLQSVKRRLDNKSQLRKNWLHMRRVMLSQTADAFHATSTSDQSRKQPVMPADTTVGVGLEASGDLEQPRASMV
eukprot:GHVQ01013399.1.p1 GENE.GHVQ01013399.1~~GHVQ01013399.1.p1  ORF type:complete len:127 (+),score=12.47 GHVQ01013399.1:213-593(+)